MSTKMQAALTLASDGLCVFPLKPGEKVPATEHGQDDAVADFGQISAWWKAMPDANIGVHCAPSGLYVVDVDCGGEKVGGESWDALVAEHGHVETLTVRTQSGGLHFYYRMPEGAVLKNTTGKLGKHIDTRGNGYVVAPGSIVNGRAYEIVSEVEIADLPEWIVEALKPKSRPAPRPVEAEFAAPAAEVHERVQQLAGDLASAPEGTRNDTAARVSFMVGQYVGAGQITYNEAEAALFGALAGWPDPADEIRMHERTIQNALQAGQAQPRPWEAARFPDRPALPVVATTDEATADEIDLTDEDGERKKPLKPPSDFNTDAGQARWFASRAERLRWVPEFGWIKWDDTRWLPIDETLVTKYIAATYSAEFQKAVQKYMADPTEDNERVCGMWRKRQSKSGVGNVVAMLKAETSLEPDGDIQPAARLDRNPPGRFLLNTQTGVVDLATGEIGPHDPALLMTKITRGRYGVPLNPKGEALWRAAWESLPGDTPAEVAETLRWMQLRFGYALTGQTAEDAVFLHGGGQNGKSTWTTDGFMPCLGSYAVKVVRTAIQSGKTDPNAPTTALADFRGARLAVMEELPDEMHLNTTAIKDVAGTSEIKARRMRMDNVTFDATHSLFINTNAKPIVNDTEWSTWRRLTMLTFPHRFSTNPQDGEKQGDPLMRRKLKANYHGVWDAMLTWAIEGARAVLADPTPVIGMEPNPEDDARCPEVVKATTLWRKESDKLLAYADDYLVADPDGLIPRTEFLAHFNEWLLANGNTKWSMALLTKRMSEHPTFKKRTSVVRPRTQAGLSHPDLERAIALPDRPQCFTGYRYRNGRPCSCPNARWGEHTTTCKDAA